MNSAEVTQRAVIVLVDDEADALARTRRALERRFAADYEIAAEQVAHQAATLLEQLAADGTPVALVLADMNMPELNGLDFLARVADLHPEARRVTLVSWGELEQAREPFLRAAGRGDVHAFVAKPWRDAHESFYRAVTSFLEEWDHVHRPQFQAIRLVGDRWDARTQALRDALYRSGVPFGFYEAETRQGEELLRRSGSDGTLPVAVLHDGRVLARPTPHQIAVALGVNAGPLAQPFDVTIVGSGPAGMAAAVYGASEGLSVLVIEHEALGGQASTSSMIRNYLGFPRGLSGAELATRGYRQAWLFGAHFLIGRTASELRVEGSQRVVVLDDGTEVRSRAVILASGVSYRRLNIDGLDEFVGRGVFYGAPVTEAPGMAGEHVVVVGGGNSSAQMALYLCRWAGRVTLVTRGAGLDEMSAYLVEEIRSRPNIEPRLNTTVAGVAGERRLETVRLRDSITGEEEDLPVGGLFIMIGAEPRTAWLPAEIERDGRGYVATGDEVSRPTDDGRRRQALETSMSGVYAVGDVRLGSLKRIAAAVGEGSSSIRMCHEFFAAQRAADGAVAGHR